jgi:hypothetical protein
MADTEHQTGLDQLVEVVDGIEQLAIDPNESSPQSDDSIGTNGDHSTQTGDDDDEDGDKSGHKGKKVVGTYRLGLDLLVYLEN